jgi:hypothetical protein
MMLVCYIVGGILVSVVALYLFLELHYFLRMCLCVIIARFFKTKVKILDDTQIHGKLSCLTTWSRVPLEMLIVIRLVKKFPVFNGT